VIYRRPDPDRDLTDPGLEVDDEPACRYCGEIVENPRFRDCDTCHWGPQDRQDDT